MKKKIPYSRRSIQVICRENSRDIVSKRVENKNDKKVVELSRCLNGSTLTRQLVNTIFPKPLETRQRERDINNGDILSKAISKLKPCLDLRQVRRGRKVFQIPRIIPPTKRQLFGVRQLLSTCASKNRPSVRVPEKFLNLSIAEERTSTAIEKGRQGSQEPLPLYSLTSRSKWPCTRAALLKSDSKRSLSPFSFSLNKEIKACSLSRSQSIENKKRSYKVAFTNRSSTRLAWWL